MKIAVSPSNGLHQTGLVGGAFEQAERGGADRDDAAARRPRGVEAVGGGGVDPAPFGVHHVVGRVVGLDREEGAGADVEGEGLVADPRLVSASISRGVKWRAAVGAATAPFSAANIVW